MKPAAIGTALLLHTAAIGALLQVGAGDPTNRDGARLLEVRMMADAPAASARHTVESLHASAADPQHPASRTTQRHPAPARTAAPAVVAPAAPLPRAAGLPASRQPTPEAGPALKTGASIPARYAATNRKPAYPLISRRQEEQGTVLLGVLVRTDGSAGAVRVRLSSGFPLLDEAALTAVKQWRFHPATVNHQPVSEWYQVAIPFKLQ